MATVKGVMVNGYLDKLSRLNANALAGGDTPANMTVDGAKFRIGVGGWEMSGGSKQPKTPSKTRTDTEAEANADYFFEKTIQVADVVDNGDGSFTVVCFIDTAEGNAENGADTTSRFYELGIYDKDDDLMVYLTFPEEYKDNTLSLKHTVTVKRR